MKKTVFIITSLLFLVIIFLGIKYGGVATGLPEVKDSESKTITHKVPNVNFKTLDGKVVNTHQFKGKVVLLNFWASWCAPCIEEFPSMLKLMDRFKGKVVFMAISNDSNKSDIESFINRFKKKYKKQISSPNFILLWDRDLGITQEHFNILKLPETFIISPDLTLPKKVIGATDWDGKEMIQSINELLAL